MTHLFICAQVVAILCLSMVASYHFSGTLICPSATKNHTLTVETSYPLYSWTLHNVSIVPLNPPNGDTTPGTPIVAAYMNGNFDNFLLGQGAQLYVTWSVATLFYCIAATLVYMVVTANEELEKVMDLLVYAVSFACCSSYTVVLEIDVVIIISFHHSSILVALSVCSVLVY